MSDRLKAWAYWNTIELNKIAAQRQLTEPEEDLRLMIGDIVALEERVRELGKVIEDRGYAFQEAQQELLRENAALRARNGVLVRWINGAMGIVGAFAGLNPKHVFDGKEQDPFGAHALHDEYFQLGIAEGCAVPSGKPESLITEKGQTGNQHGIKSQPEKGEGKGLFDDGRHGPDGKGLCASKYCKCHE